MRHYIYRNRSWTEPSGAGGYEICGKKKDEIIFECDAADILEADAKLLAATGLIAAKRVDVGLTFEDMQV